MRKLFLSLSTLGHAMDFNRAGNLSDCLFYLGLTRETYHRFLLEAVARWRDWYNPVAISVLVAELNRAFSEGRMGFVPEGQEPSYGAFPSSSNVMGIRVSTIIMCRVCIPALRRRVSSSACATSRFRSTSYARRSVARPTVFLSKSVLGSGRETGIC